MRLKGTYTPQRCDETMVGISIWIGWRYREGSLIDGRVAYRGHASSVVSSSIAALARRSVHMPYPDARPDVGERLP